MFDYQTMRYPPIPSPLPLELLFSNCYIFLECKYAAFLLHISIRKCGQSMWSDKLCYQNVKELNNEQCHKYLNEVGL